MIKAVAHREDGTPIIVAGLSGENVERLKQGKPILIRTKIDDQTVELLIMYGDTEGAIVDELQSIGLRLPTVPIEDEEGLKKHVHG